MCLGQKAILSKDAVSLPIHIEIAFGIQNYVKLSNIYLYNKTWEIWCFLYIQYNFQFNNLAIY